jgi:carboxypeptidase family protein/TonB-dependent receptor-like protein
LGKKPFSVTGEMVMKRFVSLLALLMLGVTAAHAQQQTGEIFGKVTDASGGVMPGVTVTITAPNLLQPLVATTSETGTYQFPRLEVGTYKVTFELTGFKTIINDDIRVTVGFSAQVNGQMAISGVLESITVSGQSPIVDTKETGTKQTFTNELLQSIPSARDPWVILQQTAGVAMDRENIGGNMSGQQSQYVSRGSNTFNNKWSLDGVDITDMAATGGSPTYYDFDMFDEMTINTGGVDVTQQTAGVGINLVTKAGSDKFRGSSRFYDTNHRAESQNITDAMRLQGAGAGNPIQDIQDYGIEVGGPIRKGRAWIWGAIGKQDIGVGVVNFYKPDAACQAIKADQAANTLAHSLDDINNCLNTDSTQLTTTNLKAEVQLFKGNKLSLYNLFSKKVRNARNASDTTPIESTVLQAAVPSTYGQWGWRTGPSPTYKFGDQYVVSDRLLLDVQYAHVGNNFILDFHTPDLANVQPYLIINGGINGRSTPDGSQSVNIRPVNSVNVNLNYFLPGVAGGDHSLKIGGYWKDAFNYNSSHTGGNAVARFPTLAELNNANDCALVSSGCQLQLTRDGQYIDDLKNYALYAQDTITHGKITAQLGVRYDYNKAVNLQSSVVANPLQPTWLPAINFPGADPNLAFNNFSPRLGATYDVTGDGKTLVKANYALYWGQVGNQGYDSQINPVTRVSARYAWIDFNHDKFVQANEVVGPTGAPALVTQTLTTPTGNWDPANPTSLTTANSIDPNLVNDKTNELIFGVDRQIGAGFAAGINYIWRRYDNPSDYWFPLNGVSTSGADYTAVSYTPPASACLASQNARCPTITYYQPNFFLPAVNTETTQNLHRTYNGVELTGRKRMSHRWLMNTSFAFNSAIQHYGVPGSYQDPTNIALRDGYQYDYLTTGSGLGNVYINAKWLFKLSGMYQIPGDVNVSAFLNARQGYPFEPYILSPTRPNNGGQVNVLLDPVGENRLPNYQNLDFHIERPVKVGTVRFVPAIDIFNIVNANTVQAYQRQQNATTANNISAVVAPRVARFGVRVTW